MAAGARETVLEKVLVLVCVMQEMFGGGSSSAGEGWRAIFLMKRNLGEIKGSVVLASHKSAAGLCVIRGAKC